MPTMKDLVEATGAVIDDWFYSPNNPQYEQNLKLVSDAASAMYGNVGANLDNRNWDEILAASNPIQAANDALAVMYSDPAYREENTANLIEAGYKPAQAYWTYNQMNDRVGASYVPTLSEVNAVNAYFDALGLPEEKWNFDGSKVTTNKATTTPTTTPKTTTTPTTNTNTPITNTNNSTTTTTNAQQGVVVPQVMGPLLYGGSGGGNWNARQAVGGSDGSMMGAGDANYHSSLIRSLRQNSMTPFSTNAGVLMAPNMGSSTSNWTPPTSGAGGAFNPQVLNPRTASPQEVTDWNAYNTYRTNALNSKTPIVSFAEWLAGGKNDGTQQPTPTAPVYDPVYDPSLGGGGGGDSP